MILFADGFNIEESIHPAKQNTVLHGRPPTIFDLPRLVLRD